MTLRITIGIATWNRCELLGKTLESMSCLRVPPGIAWEVIVCDNNSTDETKATVTAAAAKLPVRYLFEGTQGKSHALNRIVDESTGNWVIFTDDDVRFEPAWLETYIEGMVRYPDADMFGGQVLPWLEKPIGRQATYLLNTFPWVNAVLNLAHDTQIANMGGRMPYGNNMAVRQSLFKRVRFDTGNTMQGGRRGAEDTVLVEHLLSLGHKGWLLADNKIHHFIPRNRVGLRWFCKWHRGAGRYLFRENTPATPPKWGIQFWLWKIVAWRMVQAISRWRPSAPRRFYECIGDAMVNIGYANARRDTHQSKHE